MVQSAYTSQSFMPTLWILDRWCALLNSTTTITAIIQLVNSIVTETPSPSWMVQLLPSQLTPATVYVPFIGHHDHSLLYDISPILVIPTFNHTYSVEII